MKYHDPLKQILSQTRPYWDRDETRTAVRWAFSKALQCRTAELGGEVYESENQQRTFYHPANLVHARVAGTAAPYSGSASVGPPCQTYFIAGSRSRCPMFSGPSSAITGH
jgi:hypothetical protein